MLCRCGCGQRVGDGREFVQGHAIRYAAFLRAEVANGSSSAFDELYSRGWLAARENNPPKLAFGIEAEFFGMSQDSAVNVLSRAGFQAQYDGYHHHPRPYWRITEDGSVNNEGCELVSPILSWNKKSYDDTRTAVTALRMRGATVDRSCGLHVHHNASSMTPYHIGETAALYALFQPIINRLLPPSRHDGSYCTSMDDPGTWWRNVQRSSSHFSNLDEFKRSCSNWGRYYAINLQAYAVHGTLEFRQHAGTLDGDKIEHWSKFTKAFMLAGQKGLSWSSLTAQYGSVDSTRDNMSVVGMCAFLGVPVKTTKFLLNREKQLKFGTDNEDHSAQVSNGYPEEPEYDDYDRESEEYYPEDY